MEEVMNQNNHNQCTLQDTPKIHLMILMNEEHLGRAALTDGEAIDKKCNAG